MGKPESAKKALFIIKTFPWNAKQKTFLDKSKFPSFLFDHHYRGQFNHLDPHLVQVDPHLTWGYWWWTPLQHMVECSSVIAAVCAGSVPQCQLWLSKVGFKRLCKKCRLWWIDMYQMFAERGVGLHPLWPMYILLSNFDLSLDSDF